MSENWTVEVNQLLWMDVGTQGAEAVPMAKEEVVSVPEVKKEVVAEPPKEEAEPAKVEEKVPEEKAEEAAEIKEEEVVTVKEEKQIEKEEKQDEEKKKEEVKEDIKDKSADYIESVIENLLEDTTRLKIDARVIEKERDTYKERWESAMQELNWLKYDSTRIAVRDEFRPLLKTMEEYMQDPKDNNSEIKMISMLYEQIASITWGDYRAEINDFYKRKAQNISKLSSNDSQWVTKVPSVLWQKQYRPTGVVRRWGWEKRF